MTIISVSQLRRSLSEVLTRVEHGEIFFVTRHGKLVAKIVPM